MESIFNEYHNHIISAVFRYLIPLLLASLIAFLGKFIGFVFSEIFSVRKILLLITIFFITLYINSYLAGWITFIFFIFLIFEILFRYFVGPKNEPNIIFAGFYDVSSVNGYFARTGASKILDAQFFRVFDEAISQMSVQKIRPMSIKSFKPPALIHSWCDYEKFEKLVNRYTKKGLGLIWGVVNKDGNLHHVEIKLNTPIYHGKSRAEEMTNRVIDVLNCTGLRSEEKTKFIARVLVAVWSNSANNNIAENGHWQLALQIAKESEQIFDKAIRDIERVNTENTTEVVKYCKKGILPSFFVEQARNRLCAEEWEEAIDKLVETILLNPFFPFMTANEFLDYYLSYYQAEVTIAAPLKDGVIDAKLEELAEKALFVTPPHLQLLINWLYGCGAKISNLDKRINTWFSKLSEAFPDNAFIFLYWAEAIKIPYRIGLMTNEKPSLSVAGNLDGLPIKVLDLAIEKCKAAYVVAPELHIISSKIAMMSLITALNYPEHSIQFKKRIKIFEEYGKKASIHIKEPNVQLFLV